MAVSFSHTTVSRGANSKAVPLYRRWGNIMVLEGLFGKIGTATARDIASWPCGRLTMQWMTQHLMRCGSDICALQPPVRNQHTTEATRRGPLRSSKQSSSAQNDLRGKRIVGNFVEWCDTHIARKPGFATTDGCWEFAESTGVFDRWHPRRVTISASWCRIPLRTL